MKSKILIVDDDIEVLKINAKYLMQEGYSVTYTNNSVKVYNCVNGSDKTIDISSFDCIVLDVMMPEIEGFALCRAIRTRYDMPIIFLSGKTEEEDRINGLVIGADDYIAKPYSIKELSVRIMVNIRRKKKLSEDKNILIFSSLKIDLIEHKTFVNDEELLLSNKEYDLLCFLASRPNEEILFREIGEKLWGTYQDSDRKSVMVNMSRLRKKLCVFSELENIIQNVWSKGYIFVDK